MSAKRGWNIISKSYQKQARIALEARAFDTFRTKKIRVDSTMF